jgi:transposase
LGTFFSLEHLVFDKFHVMVLAGKALEEVRLQLQREGAQLKGAIWSLRGNAWNLSPERQVQRKDLFRQYTQLGRAMSLCEDPPSHLLKLRPAARRSGTSVVVWLGSAQPTLALPPFGPDRSSVSGGILAYFDTKLTSGAIEAVNGIIQLAKRMARGFRNFVYFRTAAYVRVGQPNLYRCSKHELT